MSDSHPVSPNKRRRSESSDDAEPPAKRRAGSSGHSSVAFTPKTLAFLPSELLHCIFEMVLLPDNSLQPRGTTTQEEQRSAIDRAWRESMSAKSTLVSVCRGWYLPGSTFLYRNITLANLRQVDALWRTLNACPQFGELVRTITFMSTIQCEVFCEDTAHEDMARIFELCPRLTRVNDLPPNEYARLPKPKHPYPALPSTVTALHLGPHRMPRTYIYDTLAESCGRLEELSIDIDGHKTFDSLALSFPRLHTLRITCNGRSESALAMWDMPALMNLTFRASRHAARNDRLVTVFDEYERILTLHGANLQSLVFPPHYHMVMWDDVELRDYGRVIAKCPILEHVVVPAKYYDLAPVGGHPHPAVRWVDVWRDEDIYDVILTTDMKPHFPAIAGVRTIYAALAPLIIDLPRAVPPSVREDQCISLPGLDLIQEDHHLTYRLTGTGDGAEAGAEPEPVLTLELSEQDHLRHEYSQLQSLGHMWVYEHLIPEKRGRWSD
ncbi:hypothetical protein B0H17DRAFT_1139812 [Mycena rosella]|uniref:F-box domain-containing protein n=1 Tax=Mycena rosella TaxID=1033263 RepID=A0AAD7D385_MYCRO|nr:hypothetical protein B0H17DRAFT_1139812 [Mycena rosella]